MMNKKLLSFTLIFLCGCSQPIKKADGFYTESLHKVKKSNKGIVVAAHPLATKAGVQMLAQNGNAIDAAVAAAFTLAVVEPSMSGIGGRTQILIYSPKTGYHGIDATTSAPNDYDYENAPKKRYGYPSIGVPGVVKGLTKALSELGVCKIRLTGGEPTVRKDFFDILKNMKQNSNIPKITMTTNGYQLDKIAKRLHESGLDGINISIDSLNREIFKKLTGHDRLLQILEGIKILQKLNFKNIKVN